jgi:hypothetical protein
MFISSLNWGCFLKGKKPEHGTDHILISEAKVKNAWNFTVTSPHGAVVVILHV